MAVYSNFANGNGAEGESHVADDAAAEKRDAFVGGLSPDTTESDLNTYFTQFGPVLHSVVKRDLTTGLSRGFGFVTFADSTGLQKLATVTMHILKGKKIDAKQAVRRAGKDVVLKIFVGGVDTSMEEDDIKAYFQRFGKVTAIQWPKDRLRDGAKKNFVFVEFEDANVVEQLVKMPKHTIGSRLCDVRKAVPSAPKPPGGGYPGAADPYGYNAYAAGYGAGAGYGAAAYADPSGYAAAGYYGAGSAAGYDQSAYGAYGDANAYAGYGAVAAAAADPAAASDPYGAAPAAAAYDPYTAAPAYYPGAEAAAFPPVRGGFRGRGVPPMAARGAAMPRPPFGAAGARGAARGFHPYRRV